MKKINTLTIKNILKSGLHYKIKQNQNTSRKITLSSILLNIYNFYKTIYTLKSKEIKFLFIYTLKNKIIKNLTKKIASLTLNYYFTANWRGGFFTNKKFIDKKTILVQSLIHFRKTLRNRYEKNKDKKLLKLILNLKSKQYKHLTTTKLIINNYALSTNFLIFLSPKKDIKIIKESKHQQKIIITLDNKKLNISDLSITNNYDKTNKNKIIYYLSLFCSI